MHDTLGHVGARGHPLPRRRRSGSAPARRRSSSSGFPPRMTSRSTDTAATAAVGRGGRADDHLAAVGATAASGHVRLTRRRAGLRAGGADRRGTPDAARRRPGGRPAGRSRCGSARPRSHRAGTPRVGGRAAGHRCTCEVASRPRVHASPFSLTCAASRSARCWSTLALATLTPMSAADSLIDTALQEAQFQYATVVVGQCVDQVGDAFRCRADRLLALRRCCDVVLDLGDLAPQGRAPVRGEHGARRVAQVARAPPRRWRSGAADAAPRGRPRR